MTAHHTQPFLQAPPLGSPKRGVVSLRNWAEQSTGLRRDRYDSWASKHGLTGHARTAGYFFVLYCHEQGIPTLDDVPATRAFFDGAVDYLNHHSLASPFKKTDYVRALRKIFEHVFEAPELPTPDEKSSDILAQALLSAGETTHTRYLSIFAAGNRSQILSALYKRSGPEAQTRMHDWCDQAQNVSAKLLKRVGKTVAEYLKKEDIYRVEDAENFPELYTDVFDKVGRMARNDEIAATCFACLRSFFTIVWGFDTFPDIAPPPISKPSGFSAGAVERGLRRHRTPVI